MIRLQAMGHGSGLWRWSRGAVLVAVVGGIVAAGSVPAAAADTTGATFSGGELQSASVGAAGCGTNFAGEPAIHVSAAGNVFLGSENGLGSGSELWRGLGAAGGAGASSCGLEYRGQPNAVVSGVSASGGDIDVAIASAPNASNNYNLYVASLNGGSVNVAHSADNGATFSQTPVQAGLPGNDREWIAAFGAHTSLLSFHDATGDIDVLRSDDDGQRYVQISQVIAATDYKAANNELGNLVIDHRNLPNSTGGFYAYHAFVAPSDPSGARNNEAFLGVSADGGHTWSDEPIPCSVSSSGLDHAFPNVSVDPAGNLWYVWSDDHHVYSATSSDHGSSWTCSGAISTSTAHAIYPWVVATSAGEDLVYYGTPTEANQTWSVYFVQNTSGAPGGWGTPQQLMAVHQGAVCESGVSCASGRQLLDDFGVDTDNLGWAHIAFTSDADPNTGQFSLGKSRSATGYALQTGGAQVGSANNSASPPPVGAGSRASSTSLSCSPGSVAVGDASTCTATVADSDAGMKSTPTGTVTFTHTQSGSFASGPSCTLSATGSAGQASCQVSYIPAAVGSGSHQVSATYAADAAHTASNATTAVIVTPPGLVTGFAAATNSDQRPGTGVPPASRPCVASRGFASVNGRANGASLELRFSRLSRAPVLVEIFESTRGNRVIGAKRVAILRNRTRSFSWGGRTGRGREVPDGYYWVRYRIVGQDGREDVRHEAYLRRHGRFSRLPAFSRPDNPCGLIERFALSAPAFGGATSRGLTVAYRLALPGNVTLELVSGRNVLRTLAVHGVVARRTHTAGFSARHLPRGNYQLRILARSGRQTARDTLTTRRL